MLLQEHEVEAFKLKAKEIVKFHIYIWAVVTSALFIWALYCGVSEILIVQTLPEDQYLLTRVFTIVALFGLLFVLWGFCVLVGIAISEKKHNVMIMFEGQAIGLLGIFEMTKLITEDDMKTIKACPDSKLKCCLLEASRQGRRIMKFELYALLD